uniref:Uncharacterized protein n=1 Tax=Spongospora subterranea TaxID=70186 RepID=A0A0H5RBV6_9EUKA|eukprot:CRZ11087.1 hypothetical protein [Spongospora subterranea]
MPFMMPRLTLVIVLVISSALGLDDLPASSENGNGTGGVTVNSILVIRRPVDNDIGSGEDKGVHRPRVRLIVIMRRHRQLTGQSPLRSHVFPRSLPSYADDESGSSQEPVLGDKGTMQNADDHLLQKDADVPPGAVNYSLLDPQLIALVIFCMGTFGGIVLFIAYLRLREPSRELCPPDHKSYSPLLLPVDASA